MTQLVMVALLAGISAGLGGAFVRASSGVVKAIGILLIAIGLIVLVVGWRSSEVQVVPYAKWYLWAGGVVAGALTDTLGRKLMGL